MTVDQEAPAPTPRPPPHPNDATRFAAALERVEQDALSMLSKLDAALPLLPEDVIESLRAKAHDMRRHASKALGEERDHQNDIKMREQREDIMRRRIAELVPERDGARLMAMTLAGVEPKVPMGPDAERLAEWAAKSALGLSSAEWERLRLAPPAERHKAFVASGGHGDSAVAADRDAARAAYLGEKAENERLRAKVVDLTNALEGRLVAPPKPRRAKPKPAPKKATKRAPKAKKGSRR